MFNMLLFVRGKQPKKERTYKVPSSKDSTLLLTNERMKNSKPQSRNGALENCLIKDWQL